VADRQCGSLTCEHVVQPRILNRNKDEAKKNNEAARLWISGIESLNRKASVRSVFDLSATPFFLRGSGYAEGTLFPWTVSDFSLMDAIECSKLGNLGLTGSVHNRFVFVRSISGI
jgi:hypothetical protein